MASVPEATPQERLLRYNNGAVFLHWLMALIIVAQVVVGFTFSGMDRGPARGDLFTMHKTLGATILLLAFVRLAWRIRRRPFRSNCRAGNVWRASGRIGHFTFF